MSTSSSPTSSRRLRSATCTTPSAASAPEPARVLRARARRRGSPRARRGRRGPAPPCAGSPACAARRPASTRPARARRCPPSRTAAPRGRRPTAGPRRPGGAAPGCDAGGAYAARGTVTAARSYRLERVSPTRAATRPSMVWGSASASTRRPRSRAVSDVTGPIETTSGCGSGSVPTQVDRSSSTVDDDVNVIASTRRRRAPGRARRASGRAVHGAVHGEHVDRVAARRRARRAARRAPARRGASSTRCAGALGLREGVEQRLGDEALGHEVGADAARAPAHAAVPGPIAATRTPRERAGVEAGRARGPARRTRRRRSPT